ncbi:MAG: hypothetical protein NC548_12780 [Lachnospiraceae bacterium]|nr:hypothetical protein [Lachnospiraceae bacterium]MCM1230735.1 hypothetical protein [Ruminococcus flavefaciens]
MNNYRDIAKRLRSETSIVESLINSASSRYALRDTISTMEEAADLLENLDSSRMITGVKIISSRENTIEGNINETLQNLLAKYENLEILRIDVQDVNSITVRAVITYRYMESTRS